MKRGATTASSTSTAWETQSALCAHCCTLWKRSGLSCSSRKLRRNTSTECNRSSYRSEPERKRCYSLLMLLPEKNRGTDESD